MEIGAVMLTISAALCADNADSGMFVAARFVSRWGIGIFDLRYFDT